MTYFNYKILFLSSRLTSRDPEKIIELTGFRVPPKARLVWGGKPGMTRNRKNQRGATLVEFLIYMALLSGFLVILTNIFLSITEIKIDSESISSIEQEGRFIMARIIYDLHRASSITIPATAGAASSSLVIVIDGVNYTYQLNGSNLELTNDAGTNRLNGSEAVISNLSFQRAGNVGGKHTIKAQFTVGSVAERVSGSRTKTFNFTSGLR